MKSTKMFLSLATVAMISLPCLAEQPLNSDQVTLLGYEFHNGVFYCSSASQSDLDDRQKLVGEGNKNLTFAQLYAALNFKIDGQDAISKSKAQNCGICDVYAKRLEKANRELKFIVENLEAGQLTEEELRKNDQLSDKLYNFRYGSKAVLSEAVENSMVFESANEVMPATCE